MAHRPYTTDGIAASSSVKNAIGPRSGIGQMSSTKIATASDSGTAIAVARTDVTSVPKINGNAPKLPFTGSQLLPEKNFQPQSAEQ